MTETSCGEFSVHNTNLALVQAIVITGRRETCRTRRGISVHVRTPRMPVQNRIANVPVAHSVGTRTSRWSPHVHRPQISAPVISPVISVNHSDVTSSLIGISSVWFSKMSAWAFLKIYLLNNIWGRGDSMAVRTIVVAESSVILLGRVGFDDDICYYSCGRTSRIVLEFISKPPVVSTVVYSLLFK